MSNTTLGFPKCSQLKAITFLLPSKGYCNCCVPGITGYHVHCPSERRFLSHCGSASRVHLSVLSVCLRNCKMLNKGEIPCSDSEFVYIQNFTFRELTTILKNIIHDSINKSFLIIPQLLFIYVLLCCHSFIQPL